MTNTRDRIIIKERRKGKKPMSDQDSNQRRALDRDTRTNLRLAFSEWTELKEKEGCSHCCEVTMECPFLMVVTVKEFVRLF